jgi:hypothetical protein
MLKIKIKFLLIIKILTLNFSQFLIFFFYIFRIKQDLYFFYILFLVRNFLKIPKR